MKSKIKATCSAITLIAFGLIVLYRNSLLLTDECNLSTTCMYQVELLLSLIGLCLGLELLIAPKSAALYILYKSVLPKQISPFSARLVGLMWTIMMLIVGYSRVQRLLGFYP